jgi:shikimate kinase
VADRVLVVMLPKTIKNIFIIGTFGVGKSTIGRLLAYYLQRNFCDIDRLLEKRLGVDISWMFDLEGEEKFLNRENQLLTELNQQSNLVVSTGGATILLEENRKILNSGIVIALTTDLNQQLYRVKYNKNKRPLLRGTTEETESRLRDFRLRFDALYQEIAHAVFSTSRKSALTVVKEILTYLQKDKVNN